MTYTLDDETLEAVLYFGRYSDWATARPFMSEQDWSRHSHGLVGMLRTREEHPELEKFFDKFGVPKAYLEKVLKEKQDGIQ